MEVQGFAQLVESVGSDEASHKKMRWSVQYRERSDRMLPSTFRCDSHKWQPVD